MSMLPMKSEPLLENRFSYLLASDFDHIHSASMTLATCCATTRNPRIQQKVAGLAKSNLAHRMALVIWGLS
jgi:hypothetical protein